MVGFAIIAMLVMGKGVGYCWAVGVALGCVLLVGHGDPSADRTAQHCLGAGIGAAGFLTTSRRASDLT
jgi:hypothetical protein